MDVLMWISLLISAAALVLILCAMALAAVDDGAGDEPDLSEADWDHTDWGREDLTRDEFDRSVAKYGYIGAKRGARE